MPPLTSDLNLIDKYNSGAPLEWTLLGPLLCVRNMKVFVLHGLPVQHGNVYSGWEHDEVTFLDLFIGIQGWERLARWATVPIWCPVFESTECGAQFYESGRRASRLSSVFCTVQVLLGLGNLSVYGILGSVFQGFWMCTNKWKCIRDHRKCLQYCRWPHECP